VKRGFTLIEMVVAVVLTGILFTAMYGLTDALRFDVRHYRDRLKKNETGQTLYSLLLLDLTEIREKPKVEHEAGYDRFGFLSDHSLYGIPRPWVYYFVSQKERALIRVESTEPIRFISLSATATRPLFFADVLARECDSLRLGEQFDRYDLLVRCKGVDPVVATIPKGTP